VKKNLHWIIASSRGVSLVYAIILLIFRGIARFRFIPPPFPPSPPPSPLSVGKYEESEKQNGSSRGPKEERYALSIALSMKAAQSNVGRAFQSGPTFSAFHAAGMLTANRFQPVRERRVINHPKCSCRKNNQSPLDDLVTIFTGVSRRMAPRKRTIHES